MITLVAYAELSGSEFQKTWLEGVGRLRRRQKERTRPVEHKFTHQAAYDGKVALMSIAGTCTRRMRPIDTTGR